jgi:hypothetical protein
VFLQESFECGAIGKRLDDGALFAGPYQVRRGPLAQDEPQSVYQNGLARSRLSRQEGQARAELDLERGDQRDIVDSKKLDHAWTRSGRRYNRPSEAVNAR